ncbi:MAG: O-antigen ligase family protein [Anaerolineae bacterium]|nr:O-antigen ligase family protein [Anaerolineae bacterium]
MNRLFQVNRIRPLLWLILLLAAALAAQAAITAHQTRIRGVSGGFPAPVAETAVPTLGVNAALEQYEGHTLDAALVWIEEGGFTWVRQSFRLSQIAPQAGDGLGRSQDDFDWATSDRILDALARHPRLRLVAVLGDDPPVPPTDPDRFASFAGAFAARYGAQVDYYQVWDEPNLADHWGETLVKPPAYADLLARTARAVRTADPDARILLAGLAPTVETGPQNLSDVRYLEQLYLAGAAPYFDIVAGKPYGFYTGPDDRRADESVLNFSRLILLREVMVKHGDADKAVWASHWGWNALPPDWKGAPSLWGQTDAATQASYTVAALERARAEWPWVGAMILEHLQPAVPTDDPHWGFALVGQDDAPRPVYDAAASWSAALPDAAPAGGYPAQNPWATYLGNWRVGDLGADSGPDGDRAAFSFDGPSVALTVRRGPHRAFLYVTVDGRPANALPQDKAGRSYIVLYDSEPTIATVPLATGLSPGPHVVEVVAERGQDQWTMVDWRVGTEPVRDGFGWKMTGLSIAALAMMALLIRDARQVDWTTLKRAFLGWPEWSKVALTAGLVGLSWIAAAASWGRDWGSPWFVFSLPALPLLAALFAWRPDLGLATVAFAAPFYTQSSAMLYRALSLPEVLIVLCGVGAAVRRLNRAGERRSERRPHLTLVDWSVLLLVLAAISAGLAAADKLAALFELRAVFLLPALFYLLLRLDGQVTWRAVDSFVLGAVGVALVGLAQYVTGRNVVIAEGGLPRLLSVYPSPNNVGLYLGRVWPLLVAVALWGERGRRRTLYAVALLPTTLAVVLSFSRGALLLGIPAALLPMGWRAGGRWRWAAAALVGAGALAWIPLMHVPRFASLLDLDRGGTFFRLELWHSSLSMLRERPWFGVGPGNFLEAYRTRYVLHSAWQEFNLEHPHNIYLDHWTRLGVPGVIAGAVSQIAFWRVVRHKSRRDALTLGLVGGMAALLAHGLVDNTLFFTDLALAFFLALALVQRDSSKQSPDKM